MKITKYAGCITIDTVEHIEKFEVKSTTLQKLTDILQQEGVKRGDKRAAGDLYMIEEGSHTET